jgi:hypothetical protein
MANMNARKPSFLTSARKSGIVRPALGIPKKDDVVKLISIVALIQRLISDAGTRAFVKLGFGF